MLLTDTMTKLLDASESDSYTRKDAGLRIQAAARGGVQFIV